MIPNPHAVLEIGVHEFVERDRVAVVADHLTHAGGYLFTATSVAVLLVAEERSVAFTNNHCRVAGVLRHAGPPFVNVRVEENGIVVLIPKTILENALYYHDLPLNVKKRQKP